MTPIYNLVTLSDASSTLPTIQAYAIPLFAATIVLAAVFLGLMLGGQVTHRFVRAVGGSIRAAVGLKRGGRRGRCSRR